MKRIAIAVAVLIVLAAAASGGWRAWVRSAQIPDLRVDGGWSSPGGERLLAFGAARGRGGEALVVLAGHGVVEQADRMASRPSFARNGTRAAWVRTDGDAWTIAVCDLATGEVRTAWLFREQPAGVAMAPDGAAFAVYVGGRVELYDAAGGKALWSADLRWPGSTDPLFFFATDERLLFYPPQRGEAHPGRTPVVHPVLALDVRTRAVSEVTSFTSDVPGLFVRPSSDGRSFLTLERNRTVVKLDAQPLATGGLKLRAAAFLADGGAALVLLGERGSIVRSGACAVSLAEPPGEAWIRETDSRRVFVAVAAQEKGAWRLYDVDLNRCAARPLGAFAPLDPEELWFAAALPRGAGEWPGGQWFVNAARQLERIRP
ncbi:MAG TPA: hypothetical protein VE010_21660 [Thermoanaerobaculia bacterium]|nr:hypothetical protein [Thermoanaerobaculia bacterium]